MRPFLATVIAFAFVFYDPSGCNSGSKGQGQPAPRQTRLIVPVNLGADDTLTDAKFGNTLDFRPPNSASAGQAFFVLFKNNKTPCEGGMCYSRAHYPITRNATSRKVLILP